MGSIDYDKLKKKPRYVIKEVIMSGNLQFNWARTAYLWGIQAPKKKMGGLIIKRVDRSTAFFLTPATFLFFLFRIREFSLSLRGLKSNTQRFFLVSFAQELIGHLHDQHLNTYYPKENVSTLFIIVDVLFSNKEQWCIDLTTFWDAFDSFRWILISILI